MNEARRDLYAVLGVHRNASTDEIRRAYRDLARRAHPDRQGEDVGTLERFKRINFAFEVLTDGRRRLLYDEFGEASLRPGFDPDAQRRYRRWQPPGVRTPGWSGNLGDVFPTVGNAGRGAAPVFDEKDVDAFLAAALERRRVEAGSRTTPGRGPDGPSGVTLSLREAVHGTEREVTGTGGERVRLRIPPGVRDGERLRARRRGQEDLWVEVRVLAHPRIRRDGDDLMVDVPLTLGEAWRGTRIPVPGVGGTVDVEIPAGARTGDRVVVEGAGMPRREGGRGRVIARVEVVAPPRSTQAAPLFEALDRLYGASFRDDLDW